MLQEETTDVRLPPVASRFMRYARIDTTANPASTRTPSSEGQLRLGRLLAEELDHFGAQDIEVTASGYVYATIPPLEGDGLPTIGILAHLDTSPDADGANVRPVVHPDYNGGRLHLPGDSTRVLDPDIQPQLLEHLGHDIITSDGTTLLGSDDKAGVAVIMQLVEDLMSDLTQRPPIRICFTVDEEIGRGVDHIDLELFGADVAYTIDGGGRDTVYTATFNAADAVVDVTGYSVHPGYASGRMVNAVRIVGDLLNRLPKDEGPETTEGMDGFYHPHEIQSGSVGTASLRILLRDFTSEGLERRKSHLRDTVRALQEQYPGSKCSLTITNRYRNMREYIVESDPRAITFAILAAAEIGIEMREEAVRGGTDGARLSEMGLPTPNIFNGGHDYHSVYEWNTVQNLERSLEYVKALVKYWGAHG